MLHFRAALGRIYDVFKDLIWNIVMRRGLSFFMLLGFFFIYWMASPLEAQDIDVTGVRFEERGDTVIVRYELHGTPGKKYRVNLLLSDNGGDSFTIHPSTLWGDVGRHVTQGTDKVIYWNVKRDIPQGLHGDDFVFAVDAAIQKNHGLPYYIGGAVLVGSVVAIVSTSGGKEPTTGSIVISVPKH